MPYRTIVSVVFSWVVVASLAACGADSGSLASSSTPTDPGAPSAQTPPSPAQNGSDAGSAAFDAGTPGSSNPSPGSTPSANDSGSSATPPTGPDGGSSDLAAARALCVQTINDYRATLSLPPYAAWDAIDTCVDGEAEADSISGTPHSAFGTCAEHAQNECPEWPHGPGALIPPCLQDMWNEGPGTDFEAHGHYINMSSTKYTKVSCGFFLAADGKWWGTQDFR